jgi:hypothetical protein
MVCLAQTVPLPCVKISTITQANQNELPLQPRHLGLPSGASKRIYESLVYLGQTVHLSCIDTNTVSKRNETRFHMTHIT